MFVSETYEVVDAWKYTVDGSNLDGTFTVADGYITNCQSNTGITNFDINGDFELSFQHYMDSSSVSGSNGNALWNIGTDNNNGLLIGVECTNKRIRIYDRSNGSSSSVQIQENVFSINTWNTFIIKYQNGVWSITINGYTLTYAKTFIPTSIHLYENYPQTRIREFMIKAL